MIKQMANYVILVPKDPKKEASLVFFLKYDIIAFMKTARFTKKAEDFICAFCGAYVHGNGYTNHCPKCLSSLHVDIYPGDRAAECHGLMLADHYEQKRGQEYIVHKCVKCGYMHPNKVNPDDNREAIIALSNGTISEYRDTLKTLPKHP